MVKNNNRSNQQKSNFARATHFFCTFLCRCFGRLQRETSRNFLVTRFMEELSYVFLFTFFSLPLIFTLVAASISHFHRGYNVHIIRPTKNDSFVFYLSLQLSVALFLSLSAGLPPIFSFSLFLYIPNFVDMKFNQSLILQTKRIQKQFPLSVFVFIDSLVVSASQDAGGYAISRQNNLQLHLGCHTCYLSNFAFVCLWCGRMGGRGDGHVITKISRMGR